MLFGSDASAFGPDMGWELAAWIATKNGRAALALALTGMIREDEVSRTRAKEIATMVMRTNAGKLYRLEPDVTRAVRKRLGRQLTAIVTSTIKPVHLITV